MSLLHCDHCSTYHNLNKSNPHYLLYKPQPDTMYLFSLRIGCVPLCTLTLNISHTPEKRNFNICTYWDLHHSTCLQNFTQANTMLVTLFLSVAKHKIVTVAEKMVVYPVLSEISAKPPSSTTTDCPQLWATRKSRQWYWGMGRVTPRARHMAWSEQVGGFQWWRIR